MKLKIDSYKNISNIFILKNDRFINEIIIFHGIKYNEIIYLDIDKDYSELKLLNVQAIQKEPSKLWDKKYLS